MMGSVSFLKFKSINDYFSKGERGVATLEFRGDFQGLSEEVRGGKFVKNHEKMRSCPLCRVPCLN